MNDFFTDEEEYSFPEEERAPVVRRRPDQTGIAGFFGRSINAVKEFLNPHILEPSEEEPEDDGPFAEDSEDTKPIQRQKSPGPRRPRSVNEPDPDSIWSDSSRAAINSIDLRGVTDMPSTAYNKPVFAQRSLREVKPEELWEIVEKMRENTVVMLNLEACTEADVDKIITFLSGAACFQQGVVRPNGSRSYVLTPPNAEVDSDQKLDIRTGIQ